MVQEIQDLDRRLESLSLEKPGLGEAAAFYRQVLPILLKRRRAPIPSSWIKGRPSKNWRMGCQVLVGEELPFSQAADLALLLDLCQAVESLPEAVSADDSAQAPGILPGASQSRAREVQNPVRLRAGLDTAAADLPGRLLRDTGPAPARRLRSWAWISRCSLPGAELPEAIPAEPGPPAWLAGLMKSIFLVGSWASAPSAGISHCSASCKACSGLPPALRPVRGGLAVQPAPVRLLRDHKYQVLGFLRLGEKPRKPRSKPARPAIPT